MADSSSGEDACRGDLDHEGFLVDVESTEGPWRVRSWWFYFGRDVMPAGLDIEHSSVPIDFRNARKATRLPAGAPRPLPLSRAVVDGLPIGTILREHRDEAAQLMLAEAGPPESGFHGWAAGKAADVTAPATSRPTSADAHYRTVAELYARTSGRNRPRQVWQALVRQGYTFSRAGRTVSPSPDRVRQWIAKAKALGYIAEDA